MGKSFGFVHIDIECKNISISGDIGGLILSTKYSEFRKTKTFYFSVSRTGYRKQIYQNKTLQFSSKTH